MPKNSDTNYYISPAEAIQKQRELRKQIKIQPLRREVKTVAGADISFNRGSDDLYAGFVLLRLSDLKVVARSLAKKKVNFPYIPGLLAFREIPALMKAWKQLKTKPDAVIIDGHGLAHPRRMGIATHFGLLTDQPAIGCAKNLLTGSHKKLDQRQGSFQFITEKAEKIGMAYRSREKVNPLYISPGHNVSFEDSRNIVQKCLIKYKLPETTRQAHAAVNKFRKGELETGYWKIPT